MTAKTGERDHMVEHQRGGRGAFILYLLTGVWCCILSFLRTENVILCICSVIICLAMATAWFSERSGWSVDRHPRLYRVLAVVLLVCAGVYVWLGAHPPNTWFFGLSGVMCVVCGFLFVLFSSKECIAAGQRPERSSKV